MFFRIKLISWNKGRLGSIILRGNDSTRLKFKWAHLNISLVQSFPLNKIKLSYRENDYRCNSTSESAKVGVAVL